VSIGVLIVTESKADREWLAELVSSLGHWPICPATSKSLDTSPPAEVALLDLDNSGANGWLESLAACKSQRERMQVLALGTRSLEEAERLSRSLRVRTILPKPLDETYLGEILNDIARSARRREASEALSRAHGEVRSFDRIITADEEFLEVIRTARRVAASDATSVLILGESGTGKELVARAIHGESRRKEGPFVEVNCAAIPSELLESELFGHEKGAFTDAHSQKMGLFQMADGGTIFLDEIGEMSSYLQAKLLKFLDSKKLRRVSGRETIDVDARIVAATNRDLFLLTKQGRFREDLYYRLNVVQLHLPPLRNRRGDIALLAGHFADRFAVKFNKGTVSIAPAAYRELESYPWPGNVLLDRTGTIEQKSLPLSGGRGGARVDVERAGDLKIELPPDGVSLDLVERRLVEAALQSAQGNVTEAARLLRVGRGKLRTMIRRHGIKAAAVPAAGEKSPEWLVGATGANPLSKEK
jgi:two-component system response regulator AtoC